MVYFPKVSNALAYNLGNSSHAISDAVGKPAPATIDYHPDKAFSWKGIKDAIKRILPMAKSAASILLPQTSPFFEAAEGLLAISNELHDSASVATVQFYYQQILDI
jgi:hypothetical protein